MQGVALLLQYVSYFRLYTVGNLENSTENEAQPLAKTVVFLYNNSIRSKAYVEYRFG